ncbi:unnamed protein product [Larinioides sclopetarius]|uniref:Uncharacterized protein n=1 Tax=Larinioides sclopetarius TaxID=280406 RepID=A0AAV1ZUT7_9ARAC
MSICHPRKQYFQHFTQPEVSINFQSSNISLISPEERGLVIHSYSETFYHKPERNFKSKKNWDRIKLWNNSRLSRPLINQEIL